MLLNPSQYSPQGLMPPFAGPQAGTPQMGPGFFGQPGAFGGNGQMQQAFGAQQSPFAGQSNPFQQSPFQQSPFQQSSFQQSPFQQSPFALNPYLQGQLSPYLQSSGGFSGVSHPAQQIVQILAHLAQQIFTQSALGQQIGASIQQLAQITVQSLQAQQGAGAGQGAGFGGPFAGGLAGQPFGGGGQPFGQSPFATSSQGGYGGIGAQGGFGQQGQVWGAGRPQTIQ